MFFTALSLKGTYIISCLILLSYYYLILLSTLSYLPHVLFLFSVNDSDQASDLGAPICTVTVNGVFPTLAINDIRGTGCAERYSRNLLWNTFSISRWNLKSSITTEFVNLIMQQFPLYSQMSFCFIFLSVLLLSNTFFNYAICMWIRNLNVHSQ